MTEGIKSKMPTAKLTSALTGAALAVLSLTACHGSGHPSPLGSVAASAGKSGAESLATSPALQRDEFTALHKLDACAGAEGFTFTVTANPQRPIRHLRVAHASDLFHPIVAAEAAARCAAPPGTRRSVKLCLEHAPVTGLHRLVLAAAKCVVGAPQ